MDASTCKFLVNAATADPATAYRLTRGARCIVRLHLHFQTSIFLVSYSATDGDYVCRLANECTQSPIATAGSFHA